MDKGGGSAVPLVLAMSNSGKDNDVTRTSLIAEMLI
jgi:hypothetical protein